MLDTIQQAIKAHDQYQVEIKLDYEMQHTKRTKYRIATYIFLPQTLGVTEQTYPKRYFYQDVQSHIRLKTPSLNLREFTEGRRSPLRKIKEFVTAGDWIARSDERDWLLTQFKLLSAMLKSSLREHFLLIQKRVTEADASPHAKAYYLVHNLVDEYLSEVERISEQYRTLLADFNLPNVPQALFYAYSFTDESLSIMFEESAVEMFSIVDDYLKKTNREDYKLALDMLVENESKYRKKRGYESVLQEAEGNEKYLYRASILKKYASSALFLNIDVQPDGKYWEQIFFALAAGIAMIFATAVAFFFQYQYDTFTLPVFIALVIGYMFKDRIKEAGKLLFLRQLENNLFDRKIIIRTQNSKRRLGVLREKVRFVDERSVPASVLRAANRDRISDLFDDGRHDNIICYTKEIELQIENVDELFPGFPEITGINDIMRFDVRHFLNKMAEPVQRRMTIREGELQPLLCDKVYHVHMISRYKSYKKGVGKENSHLHLVLDQNGIKRINEVPTL